MTSTSRKPLRRILGLINARAGSKGVPGKNIRLLGGKPLIAWSVETAKAVPRIDRIVVSTDGEEIATAARRAGADIPFMRPAELATDASVQFDTIHYTVNRLEQERDRYDAVALLQPTCPLRSPQDVMDCIALMESTGADTVITVTQCYGGLLKTLYRMDGHGVVEPLEAGPKSGMLRQAGERVYHRVGAVYLIRRDVIMEQRQLYGDDVRAHVIDESRAMDIDTMFDWQLISAWVEAQQRLGEVKP